MIDSESKYILYDKIVAEIFKEIGARTAKNDVISLTNFNPDDEEHMCVFHVAALIHGLNHKNLFINCGILKTIKFELEHWYMRNQFKWHNGVRNVDVVALIAKIKSMNEYKQLPFGLASIYEEYYMLIDEKEEENV